MTEQYSVSDFAASVKEKYPEYKNWDDADLASAMVEKYPEYKSQIMFDNKPQKSAMPEWVSEFQSFSQNPEAPSAGNLPSAFRAAGIEPDTQKLKDMATVAERRAKNVVSGAIPTAIGVNKIVNPGTEKGLSATLEAAREWAEVKSPNLVDAVFSGIGQLGAMYTVGRFVPFAKGLNEKLPFLARQLHSGGVLGTYNAINEMANDNPEMKEFMASNKDVAPIFIGMAAADVMGLPRAFINPNILGKIVGVSGKSAAGAISAYITSKALGMDDDQSLANAGFTGGLSLLMGPRAGTTSRLKNRAADGDPVVAEEPLALPGAIQAEMPVLPAPVSVQQNAQVVPQTVAPEVILEAKKYNSASDFDNAMSGLGYGNVDIPDLKAFIDNNTQGGVNFRKLEAKLAEGGKSYFKTTVDPQTLKIEDQILVEGTMGNYPEEASNVPIVVGKDGYVIDGRHRALRALNEGKLIEAYVPATEIWNEANAGKISEANEIKQAAKREFASVAAERESEFSIQVRKAFSKGVKIPDENYSEYAPILKIDQKNGLPLDTAIDQFSEATRGVEKADMDAFMQELDNSPIVSLGKKDIAGEALRRTMEIRAKSNEEAAAIKELATETISAQGWDDDIVRAMSGPEIPPELINTIVSSVTDELGLTEYTNQEVRDAVNDVIETTRILVQEQRRTKASDSGAGAQPQALKSETTDEVKARTQAEAKAQKQDAAMSRAKAKAEKQPDDKGANAELPGMMEKAIKESTKEGKTYQMFDQGGDYPVIQKTEKRDTSDKRYRWTKALPQERFSVEFPEGLELYESLVGEGKVKIREVIAGDDRIRGAYDPRAKVIYVRADLAKDPEQAVKMFMHELGHAIDLMGRDTRLGAVNVFAHLANIKGYTLQTLSEYLGAQGKPIRSKEREAIRRRVTQDAKKNAGTIEEYYVTVPIFKESGITVEDIKNVWNSPDMTKNPELIEFVKRLSEQDKKKLIVAAMKGVVSEIAQRFTKTEQVGSQTIKKQRIVDASPEEINKLYKEALQEEIRKRLLFEHDVVRLEMEDLSRIWRGDFMKGDNYRADANELYADVFSVLMNDPDLLKKEAPYTYRILENYMSSRPDFQREYEALQRELAKPPEERIARAYDIQKSVRAEAPKKVAKGLAERAKANEKYKLGLVPTLMDMFYDKVWDFKSLAKKMKALDVKYALGNRLYNSSAVQAYLIKQTKLLGEYSKKHKDVDIDDINLFLRNLYTLSEKDAKFTSEGFRQRASDLQEEFLRRFGKEATDDLIELQSNMWENRKEVLALARKAGIYDPETLQQMEDNPFYVPSKTISGMISQDSVFFSPKVQHRVGNVKQKAPEIASLFLTDAAMIEESLRTIDLKTVANFAISQGLGQRARRAGKMSFVKNTNPNLSLITYLQNGKTVGVYLPKNVVSMFKSEDLPVGWEPLMNFFSKPNQLFREIFTSKNPVFAVNNFYRDTYDTMIALPGAHPHNYFPLVLESMLELIPAVYEGKYSADHVQGLSERAIPYFRTYGSAGTDTTLLEYSTLLKEYGLDLGAPGGLMSGGVPKKNAILSSIYKIVKGMTVDQLDNFSELSEKANRLAAFKYLKKYHPTMSAEQRADTAMHATLSFKEKGSVMPIINLFTLFANPSMKGRGRTLKAFKDNPVKWMFYKTLALLPVLFLLFKKYKDEEEWAMKIPDSEIINYALFPTKQGRVAVALDQDVKVFAAILINFFKNNPNKLDKAFGAFWSGSVEQGSVAPWLTWGGDLIKIASGQNPIDSFTGRPVINKSTFGVSKTRDFEEYWNKKIAKGLGILSYDINASGAERFPVLRTLKRAGLRATDYGYSEMAQDIKTKKEFEAQKNRAEREDAFREGVRRIVKTSTASTVMRNIYRETETLIADGLVNRRERKTWQKKIAAETLYKITNNSKYNELAKAETEKDLLELQKLFHVTGFNLERMLKKEISKYRVGGE